MHESTIFFSDAAVESVGRRFLNRTLPKSEWTHAGHFAATLYLLRCHPDLDLRSQLPPLIRAYNEKTGVINSPTTGYHETITQASIRAARAFIARAPSLSLHAACNALLASQLGKSDWLLAHWSGARLFSLDARVGWCEPDILTLPF